MKIEDRHIRSSGEDAFISYGYKHFILRMLETTLKDLIKGDEVMKKAAKNWLDPVMGRDAPVKFEDCVVAMGFASRLDEIRRRCLTAPQEMLADVESALDSIVHTSPERKKADAETFETTFFSSGRDAFASVSRALFSHG